jgi:hypothetical protein
MNIISNNTRFSMLWKFRHLDSWLERNFVISYSLGSWLLFLFFYDIYTSCMATRLVNNGAYVSYAHPNILKQTYKMLRNWKIISSPSNKKKTQTIRNCSQQNFLEQNKTYSSVFT